MKISDLGRATGVEVQTIRYYEKAGLLPAPSREANGYRGYGDQHLVRLAFGILHELVAAAHGEACACHPESTHR